MNKLLEIVNTLSVLGMLLFVSAMLVFPGDSAWYYRLPLLWLSYLYVYGNCKYPLRVRLGEARRNRESIENRVD